jgi:peptidoglycan/xylan/chitin deacetylase (PgdA/CDA1 family)
LADADWIGILRTAKGIARRMVAMAFRWSGMPILVRQVLCRKKVTIVIYHAPAPEVFEQHVLYLKRHYYLIPLDLLVDALHSSDWSRIPPKALVITFDDGCKENYHLRKILVEHNVCPTLYICSHLIGTRREFWWKAGCPESWRLKGCMNKDRLQRLKKSVGYEPCRESQTRQALSTDEVREISHCADIGSHSAFHPVLPTCTDEESHQEIEMSKSRLEEMLGSKIKHFCYPNGDYTEREIRFLKASGYRSGRTADLGWNGVNSDPYRLKAMGIEDDASLSVLCAEVCGLFGYLRYLSHGSFSGRHPRFL